MVKGGSETMNASGKVRRGTAWDTSQESGSGSSGALAHGPGAEGHSLGYDLEPIRISQPSVK